MSRRGDRRQEKLSRKIADRQRRKNHLLPRVRGRAMRAIKMSATGRAQAVPPKVEESPPEPSPPPPPAPPQQPAVAQPIPPGGILTFTPPIPGDEWWFSNLGAPAETFYTRWGRVAETTDDTDGTNGTKRTWRVHSWERMDVSELEQLDRSTFEPEVVKDAITRLGDLGAGKL